MASVEGVAAQWVEVEHELRKDSQIDLSYHLFRLFKHQFKGHVEHLASLPRSRWPRGLALLAKSEEYAPAVLCILDKS